MDQLPKRKMANIDTKPNEKGSLDKTLSSFGLSNIDPQFLNPSLLHNGFMFDREQSTNQNPHKSNKKKHNSNKYATNFEDLPQRHGPSRKNTNSRDEYEFLTVRPISRTTKSPNIHLSDDISLGSSPPTLPPPSGDIPPFLLHQIKYTSKLKNMEKNVPSVISNNGNNNNRPPLKKPLGKPRPPFSPQVQHHISSFEKPLIPKLGVGELQGNNPILQLFNNVKKKSSSLTNIFSPQSWFKESNQGIKNRNLGQNRPIHKNSQNFNRRMSSGKTQHKPRHRNKRPPIKMVEGNFHHATNYKYESPVLQKSRDEKSRRDEILKENQFFTRKLDGSKENGNIKSNVLNSAPLDIDVSESIQSPIIHNAPAGSVGKLHGPNSPNVLASGGQVDQSQQMQLQNMLKAEQLAAMIEALADQKVRTESLKMNQLTTLNQGTPANAVFVNDTKSSGTPMQVHLGLRPTDKALLGLPGQSISPLMNKRKSSYGQGFDPSGIQPEAGFKPIVVGEVQSMPSLAFSVLDSMPDEYLDQQSSHTSNGDRSGLMHPIQNGVTHIESSQPIISTQQLSNRRMNFQNPQINSFGDNLMVRFD